MSDDSNGTIDDAHMEGLDEQFMLALDQMQASQIDLSLIHI